MEKPFVKSELSIFFYVILIGGFIIFGLLSIYLWIVLLNYESGIDIGSGTMACLFSCIPLSILYITLTAKQFYFYQDYFIQKSYLLIRQKKYYSNIERYGKIVEIHKGKYAGLSGFRIVIDSKNNDMALNHADCDKLLTQLQKHIPLKENLNFEKNRGNKIRNNFKRFNLYWLIFFTIIGIYQAVDQADWQPILVGVLFGLFPLVVFEISIRIENSKKINE